jgi:DNA-binding CsgD family transcriptional regulator
LMLEAGMASIVVSAGAGERPRVMGEPAVSLLPPMVEHVVIDGSNAHPDAIHRYLHLLSNRDFVGSRMNAVLLIDPDDRTEPRYLTSIPKLAVVDGLSTLLQAVGISLDNPLTARERDVLREVASGATNEQVARRLGVAVSTVKTYLERIQAKLKSRDRASAVAIAVGREWL